MILNNAANTHNNAPKHDALDKKMSKGKITAIIVIIAAIIGCCILLNILVFNPDTFPDGSKINGVDVSGMNTTEAVNKLSDNWNQKSIVITSNGDKIGTIDDFDFEYAINDKVDKCLKPGFFKGFLRTVSKKERSMTISMTVAKTTPSFNSQFRSLSIVENGKGTVKTRNAYVNMSNTDFKIVKEVYGDNLNVNKLKASILKAIADGKTDFKYTASKYYTEPTVKSTSTKLKEKQEYCKNNLMTKITYKAALGTYVVTPYYLDKMISVDDEGNITVRDSAVKKFVKNVLSEKCSTVGATRKFTSVSGSTYTVYGGTYGYTLNVSKETKRLISDLKTGKDVTRKPIYKSTGYGTPSSGSDIGNTYIEVSIGGQYMRCVVNGKTVVSTSVVTGTTSTGHGTPTGTYYILYKSRDTTLKGSNTDGSKYATKVKYWMPFYAGDGFHDAWWRSSFGGSIYVSGGSHGCVNMPSSEAASLYNYVSAGMPVVIHG